MKKLIVLTSVLMLIFSCKKEKDKDKPASCTTSIASVSGTYKITAYTYKQSASTPEIDYYTTIFPDACDRDNVLVFNANGTYQLTDAGVACSPSGSESGTWSLTGNTMQVDGSPLTVESFDCKSLILSNSNSMVMGDKLKITLTKQ